MSTITLLPYSQTYASYFRYWLKDAKLMDLMDMGPFTNEEIEEWPTANGQVTLLVRASDGQKIVGFSNFHHFKDNAAQIGILIDPLYQGQRFGAEALSQSIDYGFKRLKLSRIVAYVKDGNQVSRRNVESRGFIFDHHDDQKKRRYYYLEAPK